MPLSFHRLKKKRNYRFTGWFETEKYKKTLVNLCYLILSFTHLSIMINCKKKRCKEENKDGKRRWLGRDAPGGILPHPWGHLTPPMGLDAPSLQKYLILYISFHIFFNALKHCTSIVWCVYFILVKHWYLLTQKWIFGPRNALRGATSPVLLYIGLGNLFHKQVAELRSRSFFCCAAMTKEPFFRFASNLIKMLLMGISSTK